MNENLIKYLYVISYALSTETEDHNSFSIIEGEEKYSRWKIERLALGSPCVKLWYEYKDEWLFCGQFDFDIQKWYFPSEFEDEEDWL